MTRPGIEPWSAGQLANNLRASPMSQYIKILDNCLQKTLKKLGKNVNINNECSSLTSKHKITLDRLTWHYIQFINHHFDKTNYLKEKMSK